MPPVKVLDLSHHNSGPNEGPIDFQTIADFGVRGVILKATQGIRDADPTFHDRGKAAADAGLLVGAYDFNTGDPAEEQVDFFLNTLAPADGLLLALDWEDNKASEMSLDLAQEYLEIADKAVGRKLWLYSGNRAKQLLASASGDVKAFFGQHPLWGCEYGPRFKMLDVNGVPLPWANWTLWQFSGDGVNAQGIRVPGLSDFDSTRVDMNTFAGPDAELAAVWAS